MRSPSAIASASAGADIIFGEEVLARGGELHLFLPCPRDDFAEQYVAPAGEEWMARFRSARRLRHGGARSAARSG